MITNLLYASPDNIIEDALIDIIYTNTINKTMNRRYSILRSDIVINANNNVNLQKECEWLKIPCISLLDISKLTDEKRFYISIEDDREILNQLFSVIKPLAEKNNIIIISESYNSASIKLGKAIKERI